MGDDDSDSEGEKRKKRRKAEYPTIESEDLYVRRYSAIG
jgi:hypothetical protein